MLPIGQIILGYTNDLFDINRDVSKERLQICYSCPLYSKKLGGSCNNKLWLNPLTGDISLVQKDGYKRGCGCILSKKTRVQNAHCPLGKW